MRLSRHALSIPLAAAIATSGLVAMVPTAVAATAGDLMISVYIEGTSNNKAIELYNPTSTALDLSKYSLTLYANGGTAATSTWTGAGSLAPGGHYVIAHASAVQTLKDKSQTTSAVVNYNGDDALALRNGTTVIDSFGQFGKDPGTTWGTSPATSLDATLTKSACTVDTVIDDAFDPATDYVGTAADDFATLGTFTCGTAVDPSPTVTPTLDPSPSTSTPVEPSASPTAPAALPLIGAVQGSGDASPMVGQAVTVRGTVTGTFQGANQFTGYYIQDAGDGNAATSDAIFVYAPGTTATKVNPGDVVEVTGAVSEFYNQTQITATTATVISSGAVPAPLQLTLPVANQEAIEGMYVTFPDALTILEYYNFGRYGEVVYGTSRQYTPTAVADPGAPAQAVLAANLANRITVDDGRGNQNPTPGIHPNGQPVTLTNYFRGGDKVANLTGVFSYRNNVWKLQPTQGADHTAATPRPDVPAVGGNLKVASFNVLNYFTTLTSQSTTARGADTAEEFERQQQKIVAAMAAIDADVFGLMEIENNGTAVENLVTALNARVGAGTYKAVNTGVLGSDAITVAMIYKPATVGLAGAWKALDLQDGKTRPSLAQTFTHLASGQKLTVDVNHLKSKGSACDGDPDTGDGQGNCNLTRVNAAKQIAAWLNTDPTGQAAGRTVVIGDLNAYDHEDPIKAFAAAGYVDMEKKFGGEYAYSYVFDGMIGYLDHSLANAGAEVSMTGSAAWHINADEISLFDYDMSFKAPTEDALWEASPYRSSDHDPVIMGFQMGTTVEPSPSPSASPSTSPSAPTATVTVPGPTVTVTTEGPATTATQTVTATQTTTATVTAPAVTSTVTTTAPAATVTATQTVTSPAQTVTATQTTTLPAETVTPPASTVTVTAPASTVTVTAPVSRAPATTVTVTVPAKRPTPQAPYELPGFHVINGRQWYTTCEPYSQTLRCRTEIWATQVALVDGTYVAKTGWVFNNLTYLPLMTKAQWGTNPLANTGTWTSNGRQFKTECDTAATGANACRSYIWTSYVAATLVDGRYTYSTKQGWVLNNMVSFKVA